VWKWNRGLLMRQIIAYIQKRSVVAYIAGVCSAWWQFWWLRLDGFLTIPRLRWARRAASKASGGLANWAAPEWSPECLFQGGALAGPPRGKSCCSRGFSSAGRWARFRPARELRWMPDKRMGRGVRPAALRAGCWFSFGAILLEYGAGMAGGCTERAGHLGRAAIGAGGVCVHGGMFATGIATAVGCVTGRDTRPRTADDGPRSVVRGPRSRPIRCKNMSVSQISLRLLRHRLWLALPKSRG